MPLLGTTRLRGGVSESFQKNIEKIDKGINRRARRLRIGSTKKSAKKARKLDSFQVNVCLDNAVTASSADCLSPDFPDSDLTNRVETVEAMSLPEIDTLIAELDLIEYHENALGCEGLVTSAQSIRDQFLVCLNEYREYLTYSPTATPTPLPTYIPTFMPTIHPTTGQPTFAPTLVPTYLPTSTPTFLPTLLPSETPTATPSWVPTLTPTMSPTVTPSTSPTKSPTVTITLSPSKFPTFSPTSAPTFENIFSKSYVWSFKSYCQASYRFGDNEAALESQLMWYHTEPGVSDLVTLVNNESNTKQQRYDACNAFCSKYKNASKTYGWGDDNACFTITNSPTSGPTIAPSPTPTTVPSTTPTPVPSSAPSPVPTWTNIFNQPFVESFKSVCGGSYAFYGKEVELQGQLDWVNGDPTIKELINRVNNGVFSNHERILACNDFCLNYKIASNLNGWGDDNACFQITYSPTFGPTISPTSRPTSMPTPVPTTSPTKPLLDRCDVDKIKKHITEKQCNELRIGFSKYLLDMNIPKNLKSYNNALISFLQIRGKPELVEYLTIESSSWNGFEKFDLVVKVSSSPTLSPSVAPSKLNPIFPQVPECDGILNPQVCEGLLSVYDDPPGGLVLPPCIQSTTRDETRCYHLPNLNFEESKSSFPTMETGVGVGAGVLFFSGLLYRLKRKSKVQKLSETSILIEGFVSNNKKSLTNPFLNKKPVDSAIISEEQFNNLIDICKSLRSALDENEYNYDKVFGRFPLITYLKFLNFVFYSVFCLLFCDANKDEDYLFSDILNYFNQGPLEPALSATPERFSSHLVLEEQDYDVYNSFFPLISWGICVSDTLPGGSIESFFDLNSNQQSLFNLMLPFSEEFNKIKDQDILKVFKSLNNVNKDDSASNESTHDAPSNKRRDGVVDRTFKRTLSRRMKSSIRRQSSFRYRAPDLTDEHKCLYLPLLTNVIKKGESFFKKQSNKKFSKKELCNIVRGSRLLIDFFISQGSDYESFAKGFETFSSK
jgi:hypothetical protein